MMQDWQFWVAAGALVLAVLGVLVQAMRRAQPEPEAGGSADLRIYRDQLAEIDRDLARGTLTVEEAARLRTEVSRRVLDADRQVRAAQPITGDGASTAARPGGALLVGGIVTAGLLAGAVGVYVWLGVPGYPDLPLSVRMDLADQTYANRPTQTMAEAAAPQRPPVPVDPAFTDLMTKLRQAMVDRPGDLRGLELLARNEAALGNFVAAKEAQAGLIAAKGAAVTAEDHAALAEIIIMAAGGVITDAAEAALVAALQADPTNGTARYYSGLMFAQIGRPDRTFALWRPLLEESPPDAPWTEPIRSQIEGVAQAAGIRYALEPATGLMSGPDESQMAAAADMTPEERQAMIAGMVGQLSDRLATEGGPASDWARLIASLGVLGEMERATEVFTEAQTLFPAGSPDAALIEAAAVEAGVIR